MPNRDRSKREAPVAIISIAQQANPNDAGHTLFFLDQLTNCSTEPVRKLWLRSSSPTDYAASPEGATGSGRPTRLIVDDVDRALMRLFSAVRSTETGPQSRAPLEIR